MQTLSLLQAHTETKSKGSMRAAQRALNKFLQNPEADADFYKPKDIYPEQENYDNPNARFFNGASDEKHRAMVRQQYERN